MSGRQVRARTGRIFWAKKNEFWQGRLRDSEEKTERGRQSKCKSEMKGNDVKKNVGGNRSRDLNTCRLRPESACKV